MHELLNFHVRKVRRGYYVATLNVRSHSSQPRLGKRFAKWRHRNFALTGGRDASEKNYKSVHATVSAAQRPSSAADKPRSGLAIGWSAGLGFIAEISVNQTNEYTVYTKLDYEISGFHHNEERR